MSDAFNHHKAGKPIPQITSLSTAFPMQFENEDSKNSEDPRRSKNPDPTRKPHRHDAGE